MGLCFLFNFAARGVSETYGVFLLPLEAEYGWLRGELTGIYFRSTWSRTASAAPVMGILTDRLGCARCLYHRHPQPGQRQPDCRAESLSSGSSISVSACSAASASRRSAWYRAGDAGRALVRRAPIDGDGHHLCGLRLRHAGHRAGSASAGGSRGLALRLYQSGLRGALAASADAFALAANHGRPRRRNRGTRDRDAAQGASLALEASGPRRAVSGGCSASSSLPPSPSTRSRPRPSPSWSEAGFAPITAATAFGFLGLLSVAGVALSGWLADRLGRRKVVTFSFLMTFAGIGLLLALPYYPALPLLSVFVIVFGNRDGLARADRLDHDRPSFRRWNRNRLWPDHPRPRG